GLRQSGEPFRMSTRPGDLVPLGGVVEEVGGAATRFMLLFRRNAASMDFDFAPAKEQARDNPVFYVQYAHARACSIFRTAQRDMPELDISPAALAGAPIERLDSAADIELIRLLGAWPRLVAAAALAHEPHRVAFYVHELAAAFHGFWAKGKDEHDLRFVNLSDANLTLARLALVDAVRQVIRNGLGILGVTAPEELS